jgi:glucose-6-phosphate isomerase
MALEAFRQAPPALHFVSNVDGQDLAAVLRQLDPQRTLFIVASKTFTTQETLANAEAAKVVPFPGRHRRGPPLCRHQQRARQGGRLRHPDHVFGFWDWVGGRFSLWSVIGLPLAIAIGASAFRDFLAGAHAMDRHFAESPPEANLPLWLGLLDVWYRNFAGLHQPLGGALSPGPAPPAGLLAAAGDGEQRQMRGPAGEPLPYATSPVVWGEAGTNGQHAYFQMLHQGSDVVPVEFIAVRRPRYGFVPEGSWRPCWRISTASCWPTAWRRRRR